MQTVYEMKDDVWGYLLVKLVFEIDFEKIEKYDVEKPWPWDKHYTVEKNLGDSEWNGANIRYFDPNPKLSPKTW